MTKPPEEIARELLLREVNRLRAASNYPAMDMETLWREGDCLLDVKSLSTAIASALNDVWDAAITTLHQMKYDCQSIYHDDAGVEFCLAAIVRLEKARNATERR